MIVQIQSVFGQSNNPTIAEGMSAYMKNHFSFIGIKAPERKALQKQFSLEIKKLSLDQTWDLILQLWQLEEREFQYFAMDIIKWRYKKPKEKDIAIIQHLITTKSWWDSVDFLAAHTCRIISFFFTISINFSIHRV